MMLSKEEIKRYSKQILLPHMGIKGQQKLSEASVLVIGAGGLGCPALQYLAAAGVGSIGIVDFDIVDETNLQRQVLYSINDVGNLKAEVAASKISELNPFISVIAFTEKFNTSNAEAILSKFDIVVDCTDNFESRCLINDICVIMNKPFVYGGIYKFEGQVSVFNYNNSATYR
ncbi:MAG: HesA/MoeB/ThiF family protein, partial [Bacteroidetes bacterium]|nr:HesA/MoeB/ThiF family protein [Bacteroidota bacterium]